ncbi:MAG: ABC transporter permease [Clostridiales bacterium]|nr:ABC transporter permease [Clostridiales bacterium]
MSNKDLNNAISKDHEKYIAKLKRTKIMVRLSQVSILAAFIILWELAARYNLIDAFITSQPSRIAETLKSLYDQGILWLHVSVTVFETIVGFVLGTLLGTAAAIVLWWSNFAAKVADPYLVVLNSLPKVALGPIIIVWIGAGPMAIIAMALFVSLIITIITVLNGFLEVSPDKIKLLKTFGATKSQILKKVILPASVPTIISALKINVGMSWVGVIVGEFLVSKAGLGHLIVYGGQVFKLDLVMTSVFILSIAAALMYQAVSWLEKKFLKWQ